MLLSNGTMNTIRATIVAQDKTIQEDHLPLYKELGITPSMFDYYEGNWEYWEQQNLTLTLTKAEREQLKTAIFEVGTIIRTQLARSYASYKTPRLSTNSQTILKKLGTSPIALGISNATDWKNY